MLQPNTVEYPQNKKSTTGLEEIWLAGGCFWGTEAYIALVEGVLTTAVGYANGTTEHPTYEDVCTGRTGFAEAVYVQYDPAIVSLSFLLELYYKSVNPHSLNKQGGDIGTQYRTGIYYLKNKEDKVKEIVTESLETLEKRLGKATVIEQGVLQNFYLAEEYHQAYLKKNPSGYCHIPQQLFSYAAAAKEYKVPTATQLKESLSTMQYHVTQEDGTEPAFQNEYYNEFRKGIYVSITTGEPLFLSSDKFEAGCGWPAFSKPIAEALVTEAQDTSYGYNRTEIRSQLGDDHLGHVFEDGPKELGGLRYCINSAALRFVPKEEMEQQGYGNLIKLVE